MMASTGNRQYAATSAHKPVQSLVGACRRTLGECGSASQHHGHVNLLWLCVVVAQARGPSHVV